jgi:hypothetical protein
MTTEASATKVKPFTIGGVFLSIFMLAVALICVAWFVNIWPTAMRWFDPDSRIGFGNNRIAHIPGAFERYSPSFGGSWELFKVCSQIKDCDSSGLIEFRDKEIKREWPDIFDRLMIDKDWGERSDTVIAHNIFLDEVEKWGRDKLRNSCVPNIIFSTVSNGRDSPVYSLDSYNCT